MQMVIKTTLVVVTALLSLVVFAPKKELYFLLEQRLEQSGVMLYGEQIKETPFGLELQDIRVRIEGVDVGTIRSVSLSLYFLINRVVLNDFSMDRNMAKMLSTPISIDRASAEYLLWHPTIVSLKAEGSFGRAEGIFDLKQRRLRLHFADIKLLGGLKAYLKNIEGNWVYEQRF